MDREKNTKRRTCAEREIPSERFRGVLEGVRNASSPEILVNFFEFFQDILQGKMR
jgi:hypothetical protein